MNDSLGKDLKKARKHKGMTLQEVSDQSGLSVSYLSQIERGLRTLTFTSLKKICEALEVEVSFFFNSRETSISKNTRHFDRNSSNFSYKNLTGPLEHPDFTPAVIELSAKETQRVPYSHTGQEFIYVLSGQLEIELDGTKETLYAHESIHIDSSMAHNWYNNTDEVVRVLLVTSKTS